MFRIGIVGSGPAAFYTAQKLLKSSKIKVDMFEKLPAPFGLIRYGVAPDHPEVKNVINTFTQVAHHENFRFFGNVSIGDNIKIKELKNFYHGIVLAYGAAQDKKLGISGENLKQVYSAIDLVGWYNGNPEKETFQPDLSGDEAVIIGHGNVALDITRILLSPIDVLKTTDIPDYVLSQLFASKIRQIHLIGRRGPLQAAFTIKEFRELINLPNARGRILLPDGMDLGPTDLAKLDRPRRRLTSLIMDSVAKQQSSVPIDGNNHWHMHFLRSPLCIFGKPDRPEDVDFIRLGINSLDGDKSVDTGETVNMPCQMVVRSIGYRSLKIDADIPFDSHRNVIPNIKGRVVEQQSDEVSQSKMYCVGWIKTGPTGTIVTTLADAQETCSTILQDMDGICARSISDDVSDLLNSRGLEFLTFDDWESLDKIELTLGQMKGKPREKLTNFIDMMIAAKKGG